VQAALALIAGANSNPGDRIAFCRERLARQQTGKLYKEFLKAPYWEE